MILRQHYSTYNGNPKIICNRQFNIYVASDKIDGGIYRCKLDNNFVCLERTGLQRPQYMCINGEQLYALIRNNQDDGSLVSFKIDKNGKLTDQTLPKSTMGKVACHLCKDENNIYIANYSSGSLTKMPDKIVKHQGKSVHPIRQEAPHIHFTCVTPDKKYICVTDLGLDEITLYDKELNLISKTNVPVGHGARHLAFHKSGKIVFCANELASTVSVFRYEDGKLTIMETVDTLFEKDNNNFPAAIRTLDDHVYVSNRGDDSISCFYLKNNRLALESVTKTGGKCPRDFDIFGNIMVCLNQESDNITLFDVSGSTLQKLNAEVKIPSPVCLVGKEMILEDIAEMTIDVKSFSKAY